MNEVESHCRNIVHNLAHGHC